MRRCSLCRSPGHNARSCPSDVRVAHYFLRQHLETLRSWERSGHVPWWIVEKAEQALERLQRAVELLDA